MATAPAMRSAGVSHQHQMERQELLLRRVDAGTYRQIQDLDVACVGNRVVVTGRSRTFYVKQLATQAVFTAAPGVKIANEIDVVSG